MLGNIILWCNILFCPAYGIVCQQMIPYAKHMENIAQQSDLFVAVSIVCEQTNPYAEHTENFVQQLDFFVAVSAVIRADIFVCWSHGKLCAAIVFVCCSQIPLLQSMPSTSTLFRMLSKNKILLCVHTFSLHSVLHFEFFWPPANFSYLITAAIVPACVKLLSLPAN